MAETMGESGATSAAAGTPPATPATTSPTGGPAGASPTGGDTGTGSATSPQGPIPFERHKAILDKAREETRQAAERFKWAEGLTETQYQAIKRKADLVDGSLRDPIAFHRQLGAWLRNHPQYGPRVQATEGTDPEPEPDLVAENGQKVYSADQLRKWQAWNHQKLTAQMTELVSPLQQRLQQQDSQAQAQTWAQSQLAEARTWPAFNDLQASIRKRMQADGRLSLHTAYQRAYQEEYLPTERQRLRDELVAEMNTKATASTANPAAPPSQTRPMTNRSWDEVWEAHYRPGS